MKLDVLAAKLREIRSDAGLRQIDLAARLGITAAAVSRIELGLRETCVETMAAWADACGRELRIEFPPKGTVAGQACPEHLEGIVALLAEQPPPVLSMVEGLLRAAGKQPSRLPAKIDPVANPGDARRRL